jgi:hypothetical protein
MCNFNIPGSLWLLPEILPPASLLINSPPPPVSQSTNVYFGKVYPNLSDTISLSSSNVFNFAEILAP